MAGAAFSIGVAFVFSNGLSSECVRSGLRDVVANSARVERRGVRRLCKLMRLMQSVGQSTTLGLPRLESRWDTRHSVVLYRCVVWMLGTRA